MRETIRQHFRFLVDSLALAIPLQYVMSPVFGWSVFSTAWTTSALIVVSARYLSPSIFNWLNRLKRQRTPNPEPNFEPNDNQDPELNPDQNQPVPVALSPKDRILQALQNRNNTLGVLDNAIEDKVFNESTIFIEAAFKILGEETFNEQYQDSDIDDILAEIVHLLPNAKDSEAAAIARKLELDDEAIALLNDPNKAYEDGKASQGDKLNRHTNAFHALFYWSELNPEITHLQQKLRNYAQNQWQIIRNQSSDSLVQAIQLFDWICQVDGNYAQFIEDANRYSLEQTLNNRLEEAPHPIPEAPSSPVMPAVAQVVEQETPSYLADTREQRRQRMLEAAERRQRKGHQVTGSVTPR